MKKLIMLALVAIGTLGVQAAAVNWKVTGSLANNKTVYAFLESDRATVTAMLQGVNTVDAFAEALTSSGLNYSSGKGASSAAAGSISSSSLTAGSSYDLFFVTIGGTDPAYRITTDTISATAYAESSPSSTFPTLAISSSNLTASQKFSAQTPAVPEPTSGLLMLVGLGALALRRRCA